MNDRMKVNNKDMFVVLHDCQSQSDSREVMTSFKFDGETQWTKVKNKEVENGRFRFLKCKGCGHNDFNDDGRFMNEYSCNGCGGFVEISIS